MEGRKLLYAQVFDGWQKLLKLSLQTLFLWIFESFVSFHTHIHTWLELKNMRRSTSFCRKYYSQIGRKKELEAMREEREWFFECCILDIYYSLNSIIHWIAWTHSTHVQWWIRLFNKGEILAPSCHDILSVFLYLVQKSRVEKDNNKSQLLLSCHATQVWIFQYIALIK